MERGHYKDDGSLMFILFMFILHGKTAAIKAQVELLSKWLRLHFVDIPQRRSIQTILSAYEFVNIVLLGVVSVRSALLAVLHKSSHLDLYLFKKKTKKQELSKSLILFMSNHHGS